MTTEEKSSVMLEQGADEVVKGERQHRRRKHSRHAKQERYVAKWTDADIMERGALGKVASYNLRDGVGKIVRDDGEEKTPTLFVHFSSIVKPNGKHLVSTLGIDEPVQFDVAKNGEQLEAVNVTGVKGKAVQGHEEAPERGVTTVPRWALHFIAAVDQPTRHYGLKQVNKENGEETDGDDADSETVESKTEWVPKWKDEDIVERGVLGTIKWFNMIRGYGFVARDDAGEIPDLFVHRTSVLKPNPQHIIESLHGDERIKFDIVKTEKGQEAINVTNVDGGTVVGQKYAPPVGVGYIPMWAFEMLSFYRSRNVKGGHRHHIRRPRQQHRRRRVSGTEDDNAEKNPSGERVQKRRVRKPRNARPTGDAAVNELSEGVEKIEVKTE